MSDEPDSHVPRLRDSLTAISVAQVGLFVLAVLYSVYVSRSVLLPVILALLVTLLLAPVHRVLSSWFRLPSFLAALLLMAGLVVALGTGIYHLGGPASRYAAQFGEESVRQRVREAFIPITGIQQEIRNMAESVEEMNERRTEETQVSVPEAPGVDEAPAQPPRRETEAPVKVEIRSDPTDVIYRHLGEFGYHLVVTLILACFLLGFGPALVDGVSRGTLTDVVLREVQRDVSHYLLSITAINAGLGVVVAGAMLLLGMPNPLLWGAMAMVLNYIPYLGALIAVVVLMLAAAAAMPGNAIFTVPLVYYILTFIEGNFVTPTIIGRRFTINPIVIFVWVVAWGAMWGLPGMLIALPVLMVFRIVCTRVPALQPVERVISVRETPVARKVSP